VIPHWADGTLYRVVPPNKGLAERLGLCNRFMVLYAGNIGRLQGLENLVEAAELLQEALPSLRVVLVGDGLERERLKAIATERAISNVVFMDPQPPHVIVAYSALAAILYVGLVTSSLSALSVPSKVPTYLACGRPILCNIPGETAELVKRGSFGINCESNSAQGIAQGIQRMVALSERERAAMSRNAREMFSHEFAMTPLLERHERLMRALLT
jgi:glycosyltransferase involved in cell wall biosynthesis